MTQSTILAHGAVVEALRPRSSGQSVNVHIVRPQKEPTPDYERMRRAVHGAEGQNASDAKEGKPSHDR